MYNCVHAFFSGNQRNGCIYRSHRRQDSSRDNGIAGGIRRQLPDSTTDAPRIRIRRTSLASTPSPNTANNHNHNSSAPRHYQHPRRHRNPSDRSHVSVRYSLTASLGVTPFVFCSIASKYFNTSNEGFRSFTIVITGYFCSCLSSQIFLHLWRQIGMPLLPLLIDSEVHHNIADLRRVVMSIEHHYFPPQDVVVVIAISLPLPPPFLPLPPPHPPPPTPPPSLHPPLLYLTTAVIIVVAIVG